VSLWSVQGRAHDPRGLGEGGGIIEGANSSAAQGLATSRFGTATVGVRVGHGNLRMAEPHGVAQSPPTPRTSHTSGRNRQGRAPGETRIALLTVV
jgi:hypothetical protein